MDSFRSHRVRKCEVSAGYQGEVWRSKLMGCGNPVDRTWSSVAAYALCDRIGIQVRGQFHCVGSCVEID